MSDGGPLWIVRHHSPSPIHVVRFVRLHDADKAHDFLLAGDEQGRVSLSLLNDARPRYFWQAHEQSVLGVDVVTVQRTTYIVTQGRDNKLKVFVLDTTFVLPSLAVLPSRIQQDLPVPTMQTSIDINALNYCPFSALGNMIAVPHTLDSGYVDIIDIRTNERVVRALGQADIQSAATKAQRAHSDDSLRGQSHRVLAGYEDGYVRLWSCNYDVDGGKTNESLLWASRFHSESIMSSAVHGSFAVSVAADDQVVRYDMTDGKRIAHTKCKSMGNATVSIRSDGKRIAVGGWDGNVRIYDETLKHLSTLRYHKDTVQSISYMQSRRVSFKSNDDEDDEEAHEGMSIQALRRIDVADILVTAGKEGRMCLWS